MGSKMKKLRLVLVIFTIAVIGTVSFIMSTLPIIVSTLPNVTTIDSNHSNPIAPATVDTAMGEPTDASSELVGGKWVGLCPKASRTIGDFKNTIERDPVLRSYYSGFDWSVAEFTVLTRPTRATVSFRVGDAIRMGTKEITLPFRDAYITDGKRKIRYYCCNDFVPVPEPMIPGPTPESIPSSVPAAEPKHFSSDEAITTTEPIVTNHEEVPMYAPVVGGGIPPVGGGGGKTPKEPIAVPEPSTIVLLLLGIVALIVKKW